MHIADVLDIKSIELGLEFKSKNELLEHLINLAQKSGKVINREEVSTEVFKREAIMSTGIGNGIALPHAKTNAIKDSVGSLVVLKSSLDFESLDGEPVNIAFLLIGNENNVGIHLRLLSKISRMLSDAAFQNNLQNCATPNEAISLFRSIDEKE